MGKALTLLTKAEKAPNYEGGDDTASVVGQSSSKGNVHQEGFDEVDPFSGEVINEDEEIVEEEEVEVVAEESAEESEEESEESEETLLKQTFKPSLLTKNICQKVSRLKQNCLRQL